jgi:hypothetical protein
MPIEVRELVIKAVVEQENGGNVSGTAAPSNNNSVSRDEEMIKVCVEKVLEILEDRYER